MRDAANEVGRFVRDLAWRDLPANVRSQAVRSVLDLTGCAVAGTTTPAFAATLAFAETTFGHGDASVVARTEASRSAGAVLCNAVAANALDMDDGYRPLKGHPGAVVIPAALTAAELSSCTGARFLAAVVAGYEVALRTGTLVHQEYAYYHGTGSWAAAGAAAAVAAVRQSDPVDAAAAVGNAEFRAPMTPEMRAVSYPSTLKDGIGWGAVTGYTACDMTASGVTAPPGLLVTQPDACSGLGSEFLIADTYLKRYATCRWAQPAITAVGHCLHALAVSTDRVDRVIVGTFGEAAELTTRRPRRSEEAQFSLPWAVACGVVDGAMGPAHVAPDRLQDTRLLDQAARVEMLVDPDLDAAFPERALAWAEVHTVDGRSARSPVLPAPGDAGDPLPDDVVAAKFHELVAPVLGPDAAARLEQQVRGLPDAATVQGLTSALRGDRPPPIRP